MWLRKQRIMSRNCRKVIYLAHRYKVIRPIEQMSKDHRPKSLLPLSERWPAWAEYALALGAVLSAIGARSLLTPLLGDRVPFITLFLVMMPLLLLVRPGAFLSAALLGLILTWYIILFPE